MDQRKCHTSTCAFPSNFPVDDRRGANTPKSVASVIQSSPCARVEKRRRWVSSQSTSTRKNSNEPPITSMSSAKPDDEEQMIKLTQEDKAWKRINFQSVRMKIHLYLVSYIDVFSFHFLLVGAVPVFSRLLPASRSHI